MPFPCPQSPVAAFCVILGFPKVFVTVSHGLVLAMGAKCTLLFLH